jgi:dTDP-4-dehydrorhamnose 3,5-epimerase
LIKVVETELSGVFILEPQILSDARGHFSRVWCKEEFEKAGLNTDLQQSSVSFNLKQGTLRGLHFQEMPFGEHKIVRCTRGSIFDVVLDLRPDSKTYKKWLSFELTQDNYRMLYISPGIAHGFITLSDNTELSYDMMQKYNPVYARGVRWNDPKFNIIWPEARITVISDQDQNWPNFTD